MTTPVVGIGASAGGLESFSPLLAHLPANTGLAFVFVQHLDPKHHSNLTDILARVSAIPVRQATDGEEIEPNYLYVIPPDAGLEIVGQALRMTPRPPVSSGPHLPIDRFFRSLAQECGSRAIGVILSGAGTDGAGGLEAVKAAGGVAFAQDPTTAGIPVRALTRNPDKPEARALVGHGTAVVRGDLNDPISLTRALEAVDSVYSVQASTGGPEAELREGVNLISAAARQRLSLFAYSSVGSADQNTGIPHFDSKAQIEERLRRSGLPWVILRPVFFMENWLGMRQAIDGGMLALPLKPETRLQMIAVDDIGIVAAKAFQHPGHWRGRTMELAGDELAMTELVSALANRPDSRS